MRFTLIKKVTLIVAVAILSALAIPKYVEWKQQEQERECCVNLSRLRSGITTYCANQAVRTRTASWPRVTPKAKSSRTRPVRGGGLSVQARSAIFTAGQLERWCLSLSVTVVCP